MRASCRDIVVEILARNFLVDRNLELTDEFRNFTFLDLNVIMYISSIRIVKQIYPLADI